MRACTFAIVLAVLGSGRIASADTSAAIDEESLYSCKPRTTEVEITFKPEIEVKELLAWVVGFTCKKFVLDPRVVSTGRKVTLIAPGKQSATQAYEMFTTALSTLGLTVVPKGKLMVVVESATSKGQAPPLLREPPAASEQIVRYIMRPQHAQPDLLRQAFAALKSDVGDVQAIGALVLITDHANNVRDMISIATLVDVPGGTDSIYTIPVHHADATKLHDKLALLLPKDAKDGKDASKIIVDDRTNTLIVAGTSNAYLRVRALVERLDIALDIEGNNLHVYQVGHAVADELAKTITDAIQAQSQGAANDKRGLGPLEGSVRVISDKATNKLIVMASGRDFLAIREVIRELDVPRRQVYIEAMILEVQTSNGLQLGTSSHASYASSSTGSVLVGGVQAPSLKSTSLSSLTSANGLLGGLIGSTLANSTALFGTSIPSYAILFQALADTSRANILSTMPIIVVDNELAKYKVGTNVPYKKGVLPTSTTSTQISTNIEREPLVLELEIKPHISSNDSVLLEVKQSSKDKATDDAELGPTWTERSVETRVLIQDQQTVILGGLMQVRDTSTESKVPVLGDIPLLGHLFKYTITGHKKMNLLIMLTPYIIKDNTDLERIRARKQREYDEFAGSLRAFDGVRYLPKIDYGRKRGLVEEINRAIVDVEAEVEARKALHDPPTVTPGLVEPPAPP